MPLQHSVRSESGLDPSQAPTRRASMEQQPVLLRPRRLAHRARAFYSILAGGSMAGMAMAFLSGTAFAQSEAAAADESDSRLLDIIVTAQRRSERLQDVPLAVSSVSAAVLNRQGVTNTQDLAQAVPNLTVIVPLNGAAPYIRGVGSRITGPGTEYAVAICSGRRLRSASRAAQTRAHWPWSEPSTPTTIPRGAAELPPPSRSRCVSCAPMGSPPRDTA